MQLNCYNEPPLLFLSFVLLCFSYVLSSGLLYKIYSRYAPEKAEEYLFVSMVLPFASAYVLLKIAIRQMEIETEKSQEELPAAADPRAQYREYFTREIKKFTGNIKTYNLEKMTFGQPEEQDELPEIPKPTVKSFVEVEFEETEDIATEPEEQIPDIKEYQLQQIREELTRAVQKLR